MDVRNLVFEGGGVKGFAHVGALRAFSERIPLTQIQRVAGTSVGAIIACLTAVGYSPEEIEKEILSLSLSDFLDDDFGFLRDTKRLLAHYGWYKGDRLLNWIESQILKKTSFKNLTFSQLEQLHYNSGAQNYKLLYLVGTNLNTRQAEVFSHESSHAKVPISLAVRISCSIPVFFQPVQLNKSIYVDGGLVRNYPITLFDNIRYNPNLESPVFGKIPFNPQTLGFQLERQTPIPPTLKSIDYFFEFLYAVIQQLVEKESESTVHSLDNHRTIMCSGLECDSTNFHLTIEQKVKLMRIGYQSADVFLSRKPRMISVECL